MDPVRQTVCLLTVQKELLLLLFSVKRRLTIIRFLQMSF
ncbi:hypothetical protein KP78_12420 [Jeotgalibacillus soli]|uniref:Uncharacterized protein n=1 Tax=Jeotgalibacillus soli TaxID=889306 RepID=A0A0C2S6V7_9BACL|nr:hypothetical protein KP78_12420 [Jeotgalibacillus soli]